MRVVSQSPSAQGGETSFLITPRSVEGSWRCDSPKAYVDGPQKSTNSSDKLKIEIPEMEEKRESADEQRDATREEDTPRGGKQADSSQSIEQRTGSASAPITSTPMSSMSPISRFECDYDTNPTNIFLELQRKEWVAAAKRAVDAPDEARTWVSRKEKHGKLRWRLLPIHAAIIFKATENVVKSLLAAYPKGAQSKDDQGMLPLHLAFRHGSTEGTVNLLLVAFPQSVEVKDRKGRIPLVLAQASASANREAFVRALERGPTYYANAAAATERAAVMAEQRAIFDSKLIEVEKKHQQDINQLKEEREGLKETVEHLQKELSKQKGATQVIVDHVNSLEAQLKSKGETERFLAVKAATLDTNLKELVEEKEKIQKELEEEIASLKEENESLKDDGSGNQCFVRSDELKALKEKAAKQEKDIKSLKMDWASSQARAAVLEAQLKSKIENEHELASQVSHLAGKLAESAAHTGNASTLYSKRVHALEEEREKLRATVNELGQKLLKVSQFMNKMTQKTHETSKKSSEEAKKKQMQLLAEAADQEKLIRTALEERKHMAELLKKQEEEMERSAKQHQEILQRLADLKNRVPTETAEDSDLPFSSSLTEEMKEMMESVLNGMPTVGSDDSELLESFMKSNKVEETGSEDDSEDDSDDESDAPFESQYSSDSECDAETYLKKTLKMLEQQSRADAADADAKDVVTEEAAETSISCNPSDEETEAQREGIENQTFSQDNA